MKLTTSFKRLYDRGFRIDRYEHLAQALGGVTKYGRTKTINILQIAEYNGVEDAFWAMRTVLQNQMDADKLIEAWDIVRDEAWPTKDEALRLLFEALDK